MLQILKLVFKYFVFLKDGFSMLFCILKFFLEEQSVFTHKCIIFRRNLRLPSQLSLLILERPDLNVKLDLFVLELVLLLDELVSSIDPLLCKVLHQGVNIDLELQLDFLSLL